MKASTFSYPRAIGRYAAYHLSSVLGRPLIRPHSAVLSVNPGCNSRCYYCPIHLNNHLPKPPTEELIRAIDQLHELGVRKLTFSGGEPLQRSDLAELARYAKAKGITVFILTNGILLTQARLDELIETGVGGIVLSLDTLRSDLYERLRGIHIGKIESALTSLAAVSPFGKIEVVLACVVTMRNLEDLSVLPPYAAEHHMGVSYQAYNPFPGFERSDLMPTPDRFDALQGATEKLIDLRRAGYPILNSEPYLRAIPRFMLTKQSVTGSCSAGYTSINIDWNMNILPCWSLPSVSNLREHSLINIWESHQYAQVRKQMQRLDCPRCLLVCHHEYQYD